MADAVASRQHVERDRLGADAVDAGRLAYLAGRMPRRILTTLRAESLINDGTALVVFALAVAVATGAEQFTWPSVSTASRSGSRTVATVTAWRRARTGTASTSGRAAVSSSRSQKMKTSDRLAPSTLRNASS